MKTVPDIIHNKDAAPNKKIADHYKHNTLVRDEADYFPNFQDRPKANRHINTYTGLEKYEKFRSYPAGLKLGDMVYARYNPHDIWFKGVIADIRDYDAYHYGVSVIALGFDDIKLNPSANIRRTGEIRFFTNCVQYGEPSEICVNTHLYDIT
jgi:hypothetical protein